MSQRLPISTATTLSTAIVAFDIFFIIFIFRFFNNAGPSRTHNLGPGAHVWCNMGCIMHIRPQQGGGRRQISHQIFLNLLILLQKHLITLRTLLLGLGSVLAALGSDAIGYGGAGALGCIIAAFVASYGWRKQGWTSNVRDVFFFTQFAVKFPLTYKIE